MNSATPGRARPQRADAKRNYEALLAAGKSVFAQSGTQAPLEEVARRAGVGQGTLYRQFPTREHLFAAIMSESIDLLDRTARELLTAPDPWDALVQWLRLYDESAARYRGMTRVVAEGIADDSSPVAVACTPMRASFGDLFDRARAAGLVRPDLTALQLFTMISALPKDPERGTTVPPYLDVVLKGIKP
ncbi:TetR family transcriptional regulator [Asanoa ishikariensis]|uniref:Transcriptional regulator, TetR family n=1 Tax=Asanoa ishikariensis TaxID=137265 RepID=A0A1H3QQ82_9ACTN|nr:TetR/AcrR family transcriptional regulator [Asanoa ishikariensis]GIF64827.1 TetR family transcriptional regulator [Asanoa ishikariensis]SDZ15211.1 transcriptional regulator, TetR family [Asanoa ishikariensis]